MKNYIYFKTKRLRPDFRLVCEWITENVDNVDTEGNSHNPASKDWTWLYLSNRLIENEYCDIEQSENNPEIYTVESSKAEFGYFITYFLARETNAEISFDVDFKQIMTLDELADKIDKYDIQESITRTENSVWRESSLENPYPNV